MKKKEFVEHVLNSYLPNSDNLIVQKTKPLLALWKSELTLAEFKILDIYLGRINSKDDRVRTVTFSKGDLEKILGVNQLKPEVLDARLAHLMTTIKVQHPQHPDEFIRIALFERAYAKKDSSGLWQVELTCTESAKQYIFNIEEIGYLRYKLRCVVNMGSRYTYVLFLYLWENKYRKTWKVSLNELKEMLRCDQDDFYSQFKYFNQRILKKAQKEIEKVADFAYAYEPIKKGKNVIGIQFTVETLPKIEIDDSEIPDTNGNDAPLWQIALHDLELSDDQLNEIAILLDMIPRINQLSEFRSTEEAKYLYIAQKVAEINRRDSEKAIRNKFAYLKKMLVKDSEGTVKNRESQAASSGTQVFRNFTERTDNNYIDKILKQYSEN